MFVVVVFFLLLHVAIFEPKRLKSGHLRLRSIQVFDIQGILYGRVEIQNFSSSVEKYFTSKRNEQVKYFSTREEKFCISLSGHVMFYLLYKHQ